MYFTVKIYKNRKILDKYRTHKKRSFLKKIRTIKFEEQGIRTYLRVDYGKHLDIYGKMTSFWNDGDYDNKHDFLLAFEAFTEED